MKEEKRIILDETDIKIMIRDFLKSRGQPCYPNIKYHFDIYSTDEGEIEVTVS